jgi:hypothetical protein
LFRFLNSVLQKSSEKFGYQNDLLSFVILCLRLNKK